MASTTGNVEIVSLSNNTETVFHVQVP